MADYGITAIVLESAKIETVTMYTHITGTGNLTSDKPAAPIYVGKLFNSENS